MTPPALHVVTGATGLLGSHLVEQLVQQGHQVRALVRPSSDLTFLQTLPVEIVAGELSDTSFLTRALRGAKLVYHSAAKVGDWGAWSEYQHATIDATGALLASSKQAGIERFVHISTVAAYGYVPATGRLLTEDEPLGQRLGRWDHYRRAKIAAEALVREAGVPYTIVRPSWMFGPRDRVTLPRLIRALQAGKVRVIGTGANKLNLLYAGEVARGALLAGALPAALGQTYNLCSEGQATQKELLSAVTEQLHLPPVTKHAPFWLVKAYAIAEEWVRRALHTEHPPAISQYAVALVARPTLFSIEKAKRELGWQPTLSIWEGVRLTLAWWATVEKK